MKVIDKKSKYRSIRISGDVFFILLTFVVLIGAFIGSLYYREISAMDFVKTFSVVDFFYNYGDTISFWDYFFCSLLKNVIFIIVIFSSGLCIIGHPVCITVLVYSGICAGVSLTFVYFDNGVKNFFISILQILLDSIVSTFVFVLASKEAIRFSNKLFKIVINDKNEYSLNKNIKLYLLKFAVLFAIIILLSLFRSVLLIFIG